MDTAKLKEEALALRREKHQMIKTGLNAAVECNHDLAIVYTPGVSAPCLAIKDDEDLSLELTWRGNVVAVISDGTRVLGMGDIGAAAAMPVMEGKSALYKRFGQIDAIPITLDTKDPQEFIHTVKLLEKNFAGINLEDISSPKCYDIEDELKKIMNIPVFHDDQHGTAIAALAALLGALEVVGKKIEDVKVVMNGAGAAGTAIARLLLEDGVKPENMTILNSKGILFDNGKRDRVQQELIAKVNPENKQGTFDDAVKGADVLIGCSAPGVFNVESIKTMNDKSIVFAMANPVPEIMYEEAKEKGVYIYGSGRSDMPNQVNNSSVFPGLFRGALDVRARQINEEMKLAAAHALADLAIHSGKLDPDHVVVDVFDPQVPFAVAKAVAKAAIASGVARATELPEKYRD
uniref:NAD(P)-dependent malic enzyme n=1 Tax=Dialister sp. TaxID=1955814 RepID=UPI003FEDECF7